MNSHWACFFRSRLFFGLFLGKPVYPGRSVTQVGRQRDSLYVWFDQPIISRVSVQKSSKERLKNFQLIRLRNMRALLHSAWMEPVLFAWPKRTKKSRRSDCSRASWFLKKEGKVNKSGEGTWSNNQTEITFLQTHKAYRLIWKPPCGRPLAVFLIKNQFNPSSASRSAEANAPATG